MLTLATSQTTSNTSATSRLSVSLHHQLQTWTQSYLFLSRPYALTHIVPAIPANSPPATRLLTMHIPQTTSHTLATSGLAFSLHFHQQTCTHILAPSHCHKHTHKQYTSHSPAQLAHITNNVKHVSRSSSHHLIPPPPQNARAYCFLSALLLLSCLCSNTNIQPSSHPTGPRHSNHYYDQTRQSLSTPPSFLIADVRLICTLTFEVRDTQLAPPITYSTFHNTYLS